MSLKERLDRATNTKPLLEHPFYKAWTAGSLTLEDLARYSCQYWRQVESFPGYLEELGARLPNGLAKETVLSNLRDERDDDHAQLWLDFAGAVGVAEASVRHSDVEPETTSCLESFRRATETASASYALGMLYGYESQTPEVATAKICGLRDHYGIEGPAARYFELHGEVDVKHSAELLAAIEAIAQQDDATTEAEAGARAGAEAIWGLLDGVVRSEPT